MVKDCLTTDDIELVVGEFELLCVHDEKTCGAGRLLGSSCLRPLDSSCRDIDSDCLGTPTREADRTQTPSAAQLEHFDIRATSLDLTFEEISARLHDGVDGVEALAAQLRLIEKLSFAFGPRVHTWT